MRFIKAMSMGVLFVAVAWSSGSASTVTATLIETNTTWGATPGDSVYIVQPASGSTLTIRAGATLTILEGTRVRVAPGVRIVVGATTAGSLVAVGSAAKPIVFEANNGVVGGWWGIDFTNNSDLVPAASQLVQCVIRQAGTNSGLGFPVRVTDSNGVTISSCRITEFSGTGLMLDNAQGPVTGCLITDPGSTGRFPAAGDIASIAQLVPANTFVAQPAGKYAAIQLRTSELTNPVTLPRPPAGFCYITADATSLRVDHANQPVLTLLSRTVIKFETNSELRVGFNVPGAVVADSVVFTSASDDYLGDTNGDGTATVGGPGQWNSLLFLGATMDLQTSLTNCTIRYGGAGSAQVELEDADPTIADCQIRSGKMLGLSAKGVTTRGTGVHGNTFSDNLTQEFGGTIPALEHMVPTNTAVPSLDGRYNGYMIFASDLEASATLPRPPAGFCYITADATSLRVDDSHQPVLTLLSRTVIKFEGSSELRVGLTVPGAVVADSVVFTSASDDYLGDTNGDGTATVGGPGQWNSLLFLGATMDLQTSLTNCTIRYGGAGSAQVELEDADPTIADCQIRSGKTLGLSAKGVTTRGTGVHGNTFSDNLTQEFGGTIPALEHMVPTNTAVPSLDGRYNGYMIFASDLEASATLPRPPAGFCYITAGTVDIRVDHANQPVLTLLSRTVIKFESGSELRVGLTLPGAVMADSVVFTSASDDYLGDTNGDGIGTGAKPGQWNALRFLGATMDLQTSLTNCTIRYGGAGSAQVELVDAEPKLEHCRVERGGKIGLSTNSPSGLTIQNNVFLGNLGYELSAPIHAIIAMVANNTLATHPAKANGYGIEITNGVVTSNAALQRPPVPFAYVISDSILIPANTTLTVGPGVVMKFNGAKGIVATGRLLVQGQVGTPPGAPVESPVVFTALGDDYWLGDTDANDSSPNHTDPNDMTATPGNWRYVKLLAGSQNSVIQGAIFRYGGAGGTGQLDIRSLGSGTSPAVQVLDSHFYLDLNGSAPAGVHLVGSYAKLERCSFFGPSTRNGVQNDSPIIADAPSCWWGAVSGPQDPSAGAPCQNINGAGVGVSDYVNYCSPSWLVSGPAVLDSPIDPKRIIRTGILTLGPNPSRGAMLFTIDVAAGAHPALEIFDSAGRRVRQMELGNFGGTRASVSWDARDERGQRVEAGVYFARITRGGAAGTERIVLIR